MQHNRKKKSYYNILEIWKNSKKTHLHLLVPEEVFIIIWNYNIFCNGS